GSYRRRFILGSTNPALYSTTKTIQTLRIAQVDKENEVEFKENIKIKYPDDATRKRIYGFFHPYCNAGGGGEKVLWKAVETTLNFNSKNIVLIYTGDEESPKDILINVERRFGYKFNPKRIVFIYLYKRYLIEPSTWPYFTLIGQAIGTLLLCYEALSNVCPDVWVDTMGLPFSYPLVALSVKIPIITYTHFPIISGDMLGKLNVWSPRGLFKYCYWSLFMYLYTLCGSFVDVTMANSTWTYNHLKEIWRFNSEASMEKVYPPCSTDNLLKVRKNDNEEKEKVIVSLSQFRPEKRHDLILEEFSDYLQKTESTEKYKLILIGSIRSKDDEKMVKHLKEMADTLKISSHVEFVLDCGYDLLKDYLTKSEIGLNAMWNEHFGIVVVEYMAAGLIPLVHASAGPYLDIVVPWDLNQNEQVDTYNEETRSGFYFKSKKDPDYGNDPIKNSKFPGLSQCILQIEKLSQIEKTKILTRGKEIVLNKFSDVEFDNQFEKVLE
ncbi:hypothetical protein PACTADRAFT_24013, partial [Pachysolen tannophilus NRRL Y-2460]